MPWLEKNELQLINQSHVLDFTYQIQCHSLPVEHAYPLAEAITTILPWIKDKPNVGIHSIHVADSGNGWTRPIGYNGGVLHLSRRTKLTLRLPQGSLSEAKNLEGATLTVNGNTLVVGKGKKKPLQPSSTLFARYVVTSKHDEETDFTRYLIDQLRHMDIHSGKILCGRSHTIPTSKKPIHTRSTLIADLTLEESLRLQQNGIGSNRHLGCGLFIPHKSISAVGKP